MMRKSAIALVVLAVSLFALTPRNARAQDIEMFRAQQLDTQPPPASMSGIYVLTILGNSAPPVETPSQFGVISRGAIMIDGTSYRAAYEYNGNQRLNIEGTVSYDPRARTLTFNPTTRGIIPMTSRIEGKDLVSMIDGAFGLRNARIVFTYAQPLPNQQQAQSRDEEQRPEPRQQPEPQQQPEKPAVTCPAKQAGNLVEPLSNGLQLSWSKGDIAEQFGRGTGSWDSRTITYDNFRIAVGGGEEKIWHLHLTAPGVCLNSGITYGSTQADVKAVFGRTYDVTYGQYKLTFEYDGDRVIDIGIDPAAGDFTPYNRKSGTSAAPGRQPTPATPPRSSNPPKSSSASSASASSILGTWWGVQSMTQIEIKADGTYSSPNGGKGTWRMSGEDIVFTGALAGWNKGHAKLTKGGWIEFLWKDAAGYAYLFQLIRR